MDICNKNQTFKNSLDTKNALFRFIDLQRLVIKYYDGCTIDEIFCDIRTYKGYNPALIEIIPFLKNIMTNDPYELRFIENIELRYIVLLSSANNDLNY